MKRSNRLILLIGIFLAIVAFIAIVLLLGGGGGGGGGDDREGVNETTIVVAARDVPLGTTLTDALVETQVVKNTQVPAGAYELESSVIGQTITTALTDGQVITSAAWSATTTDPNIARLLEPGRRAMSVRVDQVSGVGTLIRPGDRVDVVLGISGADKFPDVTAPEGVTGDANVEAVPPGLTVKTIVQNLEVVGTLVPPPAGAEQDQENQEDTTETPSLNERQMIVILAVTAQQAEVVRFAQFEGNTITLLLRAPDDAETPDEPTTGITMRRLVDTWGVIPQELVETIFPVEEANP